MDIRAVTLKTTAAAAIAVIVWSSLAWYFGLPTSQSHGIVAGIAGAAVGAVGPDVLLWEGWQKVFTGVGAAVAGGITGAFLLMVGIIWLLRRASPLLARRLFGPPGEREQACRCPLGTAYTESEGC